MVQIYDWPKSIAPSGQLFMVAGQAQDGGFTTMGARVLTPEAGGRSMLDFTFGWHSRKESGPLYSYLVSKVTNGNVFRIPIWDSPQLVRYADLGFDGVPGSLPWQGPGGVTAYWSDGTGWEAQFGVAAIGTRQEGKTDLVLNMAGLARGLTHGHLIGVAGRAYLVDDIIYAGNNAMVTVTPPLRTDVGAGDQVTFRPRMLGVCVNPESFKALFQPAELVQPGNITFVEALV